MSPNRPSWISPAWLSLSSHSATLTHLPPLPSCSLDDLDDVLDQFTHPSTSTGQPAPAAAASPTPSGSTPNPVAAVEDPGDPDDDELDPLALGQDFTAEIQKGMEQLMAELGGGSTGTGSGEDESAELQKIMAELLKGDGGGFGGSPGTDRSGAGEEGEMAALLAALSGGGAGAFTPPPTFPPASMPSPGGADKGKAAAAPTAGAPTNFQDAIQASMSKMRESSSHATATASAESAASSDPLAAMLAQMGGLPGGAGMGEEGIQGMLDEMMEQLMSRELLYGPLKELSDKVSDGIERRREGRHSLGTGRLTVDLLLCSTPSTWPTMRPLSRQKTLPGSGSSR